MLIINADDWGRSMTETDAAFSCYSKQRINSATAMVFMADSKRAAEIGKESELDIGLHLNLNQRFDGAVNSARLSEFHSRIVRFMALGKYSQLFYNPFLRNAFRYVFQAQLEEFVRLYSRQPSHIDGHQHRHLCLNMLLDGIIPQGFRVRRSFSFSPGEKSWINRMYRSWADRRLARRYSLTDFFFSLGRSLKLGVINQVYELARGSVVELMTHPVQAAEYEYLMSDQHAQKLVELSAGTPAERLANSESR